MKIACCLSGHVREYNNVMSQANLVFKNNSDFFISTWNTTGLNTIFWCGQSDNSEFLNEENLIQTYSPVKFDIEKSSDYEHLQHLNRPFPNSPNGVNVMNTLLMFKKMSKSISYVDDSYDVIVRSRFDIKEINFELDHECEDNHIYGKNSGFPGCPTDIFFYGNTKTMKKLDISENFYSDDIINNCINAEHVLALFLQKQDIKFVNLENLRISFRTHII